MTIKEFITENNLTFEPGQRNQDSLVLAGWLCYTGKNIDDLDDILVELEDSISGYCVNVEVEFERVFSHALNNDYGSAWQTDHYKATYKY